MLSALLASVASSILTVLALRVYEPSDVNLLLVLVTALVLFITSGWYRFRNKETYDLDHAILNAETPKTLWLNMGYWKNTNEFPEACRALAIKLGELIDLQAGDRVLDIGYGCGESVAVWAATFGISDISGVTSLPEHQHHAKLLLQRSEDLPMDLRADLQVGDAVAWTASQQGVGEKYDKVVALDCAYHFRTRDAFLRSSYGVLGFAGRIGLTDLMLPPTPLSLFARIAMRFICLMAGVPFDNLITQTEYVSRLQAFGYSQIEVHDITSEVFPGLADYIDRLSKDQVLQAALDRRKVAQYMGFAKVIRWWSRGNLQFVLVKATKTR